jgi:glucose/arabinose dehydrogenase
MKRTPQNIFPYVLMSLCIILAIVLYNPLDALAQVVPEGFHLNEVVSGLLYPTALAFTPDGRMFIALKNGEVRIVKEGELLDEPLIVLGDVNSYHERGLLGIAVDPNFETNGYVYLLYTFENSPGVNREGPKTGRLIRIQVIGDSADESMKEVLLGSIGGDAENPSCSNFDITADCIRSDSSSHSVGGLRFGPDGKLYVSLGDGADFDRADPNALYALDIDALSGKVLRINTDGTAPSDNPFYNGNPDSNRSKVWSYGLRNPYRFNFSPLDGELFIADVGWGAAEEVNINSRGANYGWPCREGYGETSYNCNTENYIDPLYTYSHSEEGAASITGGSFPTNGVYPDEYMNSYFFGDYSSGFIKEMRLDENNTILGVNDFINDAGGPVEIVTGPDGAIYYVDIIAGAVRKIVYSDENQAPRAYADATPTSGQSPLEVSFSSDGSFDPDGDSLIFEWNFKDGTVASTEPNPLHTFTEDGIYHVSLTTRDPSGFEDTAIVIVRVGQEEETNVEPFHLSTSISPEDNYIGREVLIETTIGNEGLEEPFIVDIEVYNSQNEKVGQWVYEETTIPQGETRTYGYAWFPPKIGEYRVAVGVFKSGWSGLHEWVNEAASVSVISREPSGEVFSPSHQSTVVTPERVLEGETASILTRIENTGGSGSVLIDIEVIKDGVQMGQQFYDNEVLNAGETKTYTFDWEAVEAGLYAVSVGIFAEGWTELYSWNDSVALIEVDAQTSPTPEIEVIYDDALREGWFNWSWDSEIDFLSSESVFKGLHSAKVKLSSVWAGIYLHTERIDTSGKEMIRLAISGGASGGQKLRIFLYDEQGNALPPQPLERYLGQSELPRADWIIVSVPLEDLQARNRLITGVALQGMDGTVQSTFFLDEIVFE